MNQYVGVGQRCRLLIESVQENDLYSKLKKFSVHYINQSHSSCHLGFHGGHTTDRPWFQMYGSELLSADLPVSKGVRDVHSLKAVISCASENRNIKPFQ